MVVVVEDETVSLADPGDCTRFHVEHAGGDLDRGLATIGARRGPTDTVLVPLAWVRANSTAPRAEIEAMVAYAATKGWLADDDTSIVAHVERR